MKFFIDPVKALFLSRPNRFIVHCLVDGKEVRAYLPNPGRLLELLYPGKTNLYLEKTDQPGRKQPFMVVGVERKGMPVSLHTHRTNDVAQLLLEQGKVPGLEKATILKREAKREHSRFDFLLEQDGKKVWLEVKSCTLFSEKIAMFPDAPTIRGKKHLDELIAIKESDDRAAVLFVIQNPDVDYFMPNYHTDLDFTLTFLQARESVQIIPMAIGINQDLTLQQSARKLSIPWEILEREAHDEGYYLFVMKLDREEEIEIGKLGEKKFAPGYYVYIGSAKKNLEKQVARHKRIRKRKHWHIDYLREKADVVASFLIRSQDDLECLIAEAITKMADWHVTGFGCSDCNCDSHLFAFDENPKHNPEFQDFLLQWQADRLFRF